MFFLLKDVFFGFAAEEPDDMGIFAIEFWQDTGADWPGGPPDRTGAPPLVFKNCAVLTTEKKFKNHTKIRNYWKALCLDMSQ